ncbi:MAG: heme lyase CcmF/NrfE family subunit [Myxococcota bacterium]
MIGQVGNGLVLLGLGACTAGAITAVTAARTRSAEAWAWARRLVYVFAFAMLAANLVMEYALLTHDFSVKYVAQVGSLATPLHITIVSLWSSLEGSILFWGLILGGYLAAATWRNGEDNPDVMTWATATWLATAAFFCFLVAGPANPFVPGPVDVPTDGPGPNPLLQNHVLMIVHPPMLYLGYVGMTVPFGIAVGALAAGRLGAAQLQPLRAWLLVPWTFLTAGIVLGGWWAYEVLGWGGYWAWDPVENASLLPWLTATAGLHAAMLPARRGALKGWTVTLVMASFLLTLLGTFMTRSGVFNSVHSFSQSDIGPTLLAFIAVCLVGSVVLLAARLDKLEGEGATPAVVSRESVFLLNNLLFVALTFTVLLGTTYPLVAEAVRGVKLSVGEPYFNRMAVPVGVAILFLMGVGPALPWGVATKDRLKESLLLPLGVAVGATAAGWVLGARDPWPAATLFCGGFATAVTLKELFGSRALRRTGAYVVHLGVIVMILAISMSSSYRTDTEIVLAKGDCAVFEGHRICFTEARTVREAHRERQVAVIDVDGKVMEPAMNDYGMGSPIGSPDVWTRPTYDLYLSLMNIQEDSIGLHVFRTPFVMWLWVGAGVSVLGAGMALWPRRKAATAPAAVAEATAK